MPPYGTVQGFRGIRAWCDDLGLMTLVSRDDLGVMTSVSRDDLGVMTLVSRDDLGVMTYYENNNTSTIQVQCIASNKTQIVCVMLQRECYISHDLSARLRL